MPIIYQKWITRQDLRKNPDRFYVFGDNALRIGLGGQAKEMRGEPNAVGIVTKWAPDMREMSFFSDHSECQDRVRQDLARIQSLLDAGKTVVVPEDGIGTGLARLKERAPRLDQHIKDWFANAAPALAHSE